MDLNERTQKLQAIKSLSAQELQGWVLSLKFGPREPFEGEVSALMARDKEVRANVFPRKKRTRR